MIPILTAASIPGLLQPANQPCVSLVVRAEHGQVGAEVAKLELKNLLAAARDLVAADMRPHDTDALLLPVEEALEDVNPWHDLAGGLAFYLTPGSAQMFRVPGPVDSLGLVADRFAIAPVLHAILPDTAFHVLAISRNHCALYSGDRSGLERTHADALPDSLAAALWYESHENVLNRHSSSSGGRTSTISGGSASDERKDQIDRYMRKIDDAVIAALGSSAAPLVLAAVERDVSAYRSATRHPRAIVGSVVGSPDRTSASELHAGAWPLVLAHLREGLVLLSDRYRELAGTGRTVTDPGRIAALAAEGGVETLFVGRDARAWTSGGDGQRAGDHELVNDAVVDTYRTGGTVQPCDDLAMLAAPGEDVPIIAATTRAGHG